MPKRPTPLSGKEIAALYGVDPRTVQNWVALGCPHRRTAGRASFVPAEVVQWRRVRDRHEIQAATSPDEAHERARKLRAEAGLAELRLQERRGELVPVQAVEKNMERLCGVMRARILGIRGRFAPRVMGLGTMADAAAALDDIAANLLATLRESADEFDSDDSTEDAA